MNKLKSIFGKVRAALRGDGASNTGLLAVVIALAVVLNLVVYLLDVSLGLGFFVSDDRVYEISDNAKETFDKAAAEGKQVEILFCMSESELQNNATGAFVYATVSQLLDKYGDLLSVDYLNIITKQNARGERFDVSKFTKNGEKINKSSVIFVCGENYRVVTDLYTTAGFGDFYSLDANGNAIAYIGEEVASGMIRWVLADEHPAAYITVGHGEKVDSSLVTSLVCAGYDVKTSDPLDLRRREVPEDAGLVIVSQPTADFEDSIGETVRSEIKRLETYLSRGGSLIVILDPYAKAHTSLDNFLSRRGISVARTENEETHELFTDVVRDLSGAVTTDGYSFVTSVDRSTAVGSRIASVLNRYDTGSVVVSTAGALKTDAGKGAFPLLVCGSSAETYASGKRTDNGGGYAIAALSETEGENGAVGRVFVTASSYLVSSDSMTTAGYANKDFVYALLAEGFGADEPLYAPAVIRTETQTLENLTMKAARLYTALIFAIPAALAVLGIVTARKRKNR